MVESTVRSSTSHFDVVDIHGVARSMSSLQCRVVEKTIVLPMKPV